MDGRVGQGMGEWDLAIIRIVGFWIAILHFITVGGGVGGIVEY